VKLRIILALALALGISLPLRAQPDPQQQRAERRAKIESILRTKDLRTPHDGSLLRLLSDPDPLVRREATLAYGSIQDSSVIGPLTRNLTDPSLAIQEAAAFALGQTGTAMSDEGRQALAYDLIWKRLPTTLAIEALIESVGQFGTEEALNDLMVKYGNLNEGAIRRGLTMGIAKFAERGIVSDDAVRYLLRFIRPAELTPREVAYALRRVGKHALIEQEIEELVLLWRHPDPDVRIQLATLLGLVGNLPVSAHPLQTLARHDKEWRVRVSAIRALGTLPVSDAAAAVELFKELFFDQNLHVAIASLSSFPGTGISGDDTREIVRETISQLALIAQNRSDNFPWQMQAEAADALALVEGPRAFSTILRARASHPRLEERRLLALARTRSDSAAGILLETLKENEPRRHAAALEGLAYLTEHRPGDTALADLSYATLLRSLDSEDPGVLGTAAVLLREERFRRADAVTPLVRAGQALHVPSDTEILLELVKTLGAIAETRAVPYLYDLLSNPEGVIRSAAATSLRNITGQRYTPAQRDGALVTDFDFTMLGALPDSLRVDLETTLGVIGLELYPRIAPFTVMHLLKLERQRGFFRGLSFHRVVPNFVIQGGDPRGDGWGGPGWTIRSEFSALSFEQGRIGMANAGKDTEGSQFFITHSWQPHLDGRYTLFGRVVTGQDVVDRIQVDDRILGLRRTDDRAR